MDFRSVGSLEVSVAGLGCNNFGMRIDEAASKDVVDAALDAGVNHFDTADIYGKGRSEEFLGRALGSRRGDAIITTKVGDGVPEGEPGQRQRSARHARLRREPGPSRHRLHRPLPAAPARPDDAHRRDARRRSPSSSPRARCARSAAPTSPARSSTRPRGSRDELGVPRFVNAQNDYSLLNRAVEDDVLPVCERLDVMLMPYFPLASGVLTGKYRKGESAPGGLAPRRVGPDGRPVRQRREARRRRAARGVRGRPRSHAARARAVVAGRGAHRRQRHRRAPPRPSRCAPTPPPRRPGTLTDGRARRGRRAGARRRLSRRRHITGVAAIDLAPGPLADVGGAACGRLLAALDDLTDDPPRALLLRALDGVGVAEPRVADARRAARPGRRCWPSFPAPTVAVWNGPAVGAGAELLLAADLRVVGPDASMAFPEVGAGELPCWGGTQRLTRAGGCRAGAAHARGR